jgi:hypothetical protein
MTLNVLEYKVNIPNPPPLPPTSRVISVMRVIPTSPPESITRPYSVQYGAITLEKEEGTRARIGRYFRPCRLGHGWGVRSLSPANKGRKNYLFRYVPHIHTYLLNAWLQYCDRLAGVDANGTKIILCLNMRSFKDEDIIIRYRPYRTGRPSRTRTVLPGTYYYSRESLCIRLGY